MTPTNYDESKVQAYTLPPLLVAEDGSKVATAYDWVQKRRPQVLNTLKKELFGELPPRPETFTKEVVFEGNPIYKDKLIYVRWLTIEEWEAMQEDSSSEEGSSEEENSGNLFE